MLPGMELMACADLAVPTEVMRHVVRVESSFNPYAIGVVGGRLARQPRSLPEALSTARMLEREGYNFSVGLAQVNRYNLAPQGLTTYEKAFDTCPNLQAGSRILAECFSRSGNDWGKAFSCYYSGNFVTGYRHGYVQKVVASWQQAAASSGSSPIAVIPAAAASPRVPLKSSPSADPLVSRRIAEAAMPAAAGHGRTASVPQADPGPTPQAPTEGLASLHGVDDPATPVLLRPMSARADAPPAPGPPKPADPTSAQRIAADAPAPEVQRDTAFVF